MKIKGKIGNDKTKPSTFTAATNPNYRLETFFWGGKSGQYRATHR